MKIDFKKHLNENKKSQDTINKLRSAYYSLSNGIYNISPAIEALHELGDEALLLKINAKKESKILWQIKDLFKQSNLGRVL